MNENSIRLNQCPECGATNNKPCIRRNGKNKDKLHKARTATITGGGLCTPMNVVGIGIVQKDGDKWCVREPGFIDLQTSSAGFGDTVQEAIDDLIRQKKGKANGVPR